MALPGAEPVEHQVMGHEYVGVIEEVGARVRTVKPGDFVVGSFWASDNTCEICRAGYQASCVHRVLMGTIGTQSERARIPPADGTLVATPGTPDPDLLPSLIAASDVLGTGWFAAMAAQAGPGSTVAVVVYGAVGLLGVLAARQLGAERIIAFSRHAGGDDAGHPLDPPGRTHRVRRRLPRRRHPRRRAVPVRVHVHGGPDPVHEYLRHLIDLIWQRSIDPGKVFDLTLPLEQAADGYRAMDQRTATKVLLTV